MIVFEIYVDKFVYNLDCMWIMVIGIGLFYEKYLYWVI